MEILNEARIDRETENLVKKSQNGITRSSDEIADFNNASFFGDISAITKHSDTMFIKRLAEECTKAAGYKDRIVYVPVNDWAVESSPVKVLSRYIKNNPAKFKELFSGVSFLFIDTVSKDNFGLIVNKYKPEEYNTFVGLLSRLASYGTVKALTGANTIKKSPEKEVVDKKAAEAERKEKNKKELVKAVAAAVEKAEDPDPNTDDVIAKIDSDEDIINILAQVEEDEKPAISKTRAARMTQVQKEFLASTVGKTTVRSLLFNDSETIKPMHLKVNSVNKEEWDNLKFGNFEKAYDLNRDIYSIIYSLGNDNKNYPIAVRNISVEDTSTSMDYLLTYKVECEDSFGKRFTFKFDIPKLINNRFMMLRGNEKAMSGQLMLLPCLKTDADAVQLVSNYNKIFIYRYGSIGRSYPYSDRLIKALNKYKGTKIKITKGDNRLICTKYDLPTDYIDLASAFSVIETKERVYYFDADIYYKKFKADINEGIPYAVDKATSKVVYYYGDQAENILSFIIANELSSADDMLGDLFAKTKAANRLNYSQASILSNKLPLVVLLGYHIGLSNILKRSKVTYRFERTTYHGDDEAVIRFEDENLIYKVTYESSMLLNGLSECDTENYTVNEMDKRATWLDFLDKFGGRILSDGFENFKDLFMDPITIEVCKDIKLPTDYIDLLFYANNLLADNKYNRHTDISGNRYRTNEIIAAYFYIALGKAYEQYANAIRRGNKNTVLSMKQSAVLDAILTSNISSDLSTLNALLEITTAETTTFKGPSGMNSDRAYSLDKRTYDDSMINKLALSTGFSANVGIDRQATIDMDIEGTRGYIKNTNTDDMSVTKTFSMVEALTPFGTCGETF